MQKPCEFTVKSNIVCCEDGCNIRIKANVAARKLSTNGLRCYKHHLLRELTSGHEMQGAVALKKKLSTPTQ
jgi:hypothetical protein